MKNRIKDIVYGFAIGDALGVPFEFQSPEFCKNYYNNRYRTGTHNQLPGTWSDDTSILLCVLDSKGNIEKYKQNLIEWKKGSSKFNCDDTLFDIGNGTKEAIDSNFENDSSESKGNACLCVALGCWILGISKRRAENYIRLTHNNEESILASDRYINALKGILVGFTGIIDNRGRCTDSINLALNCIQDSKNFKEGVRKAICFGGDTDSNAAFTGSILSINNKIPKYYIDNLRNKEKLDNIIKEL